MANRVGTIQKARKFLKNAISGYTSPKNEPESLSTRVGLFSRDVSINMLRDAFMRDEMLNSAVRRLASDLFDNWADITIFKTNGTLNEIKTEKLEHILAEIDLKRVMRHAFISRMIHGVAAIGIGLPGNLSEPTDLPSGAIMSPKYISSIPFPQMKKFVANLNPSSDEYAKVTSLILTRPTGNAVGDILSSEDVIIHSSRFVHWPFPDLDGTNPKGVPGILPLHDVLTVKKNIDWSLGETLYQYATEKYIFQFPQSTPDNTYKDAKNNLKDFNAVTTFVYRGEPVKIDHFGGQGQLNPEPYTRYFSSLLSLGIGVPYPILFRGLTGGVSDVVQRDYASDIAAIQRNEVEPAVREFLRKIGVDVSLVVFKWKPIIEMTEQEKSYITSRRSLGRNLTSKAIGFYQKVGMAIEFDEEGWIKRVFVPDTLDNILLPLTPEQKLKEAELIQLAKAKVAPPTPPPEKPVVPPTKKPDDEEEPEIPAKNLDEDDSDEEKSAVGELLDEMRDEENKRRKERDGTQNQAQ